MVDLVALLEPAQDADRVGDGRLGHVHRLEAPFQRRILLDRAVLVQRRRPDHAQPSAREQRLEHVRRVHRALGRSGADDGVELVDEGDDAPVGRLDLLEHRLEPLLELAAVLRAGDHRGQVELDELLVLEQRRDVALDDATREALDDGGLPHAWLTDEHRVVLRAAHEHLDGATDLLVTADDRVEPTLTGGRGQVARILLERLVGRLGVGRGDALGASDRLQRLQQPIAREAGVTQHAGGAVAAGEHREHEVLGGRVLVAESLRLDECGFERADERVADAGLAGRAVGGRQRVEHRVESTTHVGRVRAGTLQQRHRQPLGLVEQRTQQMRLGRLRMVAVARRRQRGTQCILRPAGQSLEVHPVLLCCGDARARRSGARFRRLRSGRLRSGRAQVRWEQRAGALHGRCGACPGAP